MFWGVELVRDKPTRLPFSPEQHVTNQVMAATMNRDLFVYPSVGMAGPGAGGDAVMIAPPLIIGQPEVDYIVSNLSLALDDVYSHL
jgi:adenosylmethionine-8-amino-7-oxononanoate aminotransferase